MTGYKITHYCLHWWSRPVGTVLSVMRECVPSSVVRSLFRARAAVSDNLFNDYSVRIVYVLCNFKVRGQLSYMCALDAKFTRELVS